MSKPKKGTWGYEFRRVWQKTGNPGYAAYKAEMYMSRKKNADPSTKNADSSTKNADSEVRSNVGTKIFNHELMQQFVGQTIKSVEPIKLSGRTSQSDGAGFVIIFTNDDTVKVSADSFNGGVGYVVIDGQFI